MKFTKTIYVKVVAPFWNDMESTREMSEEDRRNVHEHNKVLYFETITDGNLVDHWYCGAEYRDGKLVERYGLEVRE